jgi:pimeloyl-ACP methyl ester carboxylesterase
VGQLVAHALGLVNRPDVARVRFHLVGFSAGGQVALQMADLLPDRLPKSISPALLWCGAPLAPLGTIPATTDVVTIATPLGSSGPRGWNVETVASEIAGFFSWIARLGAQLVGSDQTFTLSINEDDYGGPRPVGLCRYVAVVTSRAYDRSWGAEESPAGDPYRLGAWAPDVLNLGVQNGLPTRHTDAPRGILAQRPALFAAACDCIPRPA